MMKLVEIFFLLKAEMSERDFEGKKQMPQVATTLTKDVLLSVVGKKDHIFNFFLIKNASNYF
jgi:hypothetical protein